MFIVCDKDTTEDEIRTKFSTFGSIEYCKMLKKSNEPKGVCFLKYFKTSSAAKAMEEMNGKAITRNGSPIKIQIAEQKNSKKKYSKEPEDTPPRSRLFVVCPKEMTEEILNDRFKDFEDLEYCKVITDKINGDSKGFAYVKFNKASSAAKAMEEVLQTGVISGMKIKILIADPKEKRQEIHEMYPQTAPFYIIPTYTYPEMGPYMPPSYQYSTRLEISSKLKIEEETINEFLQNYPGWEFNEFISTGDDPRVSTKLISEFSSTESAISAQHALDNLEFPVGSRNFLKCSFVPPVYDYNVNPMYQSIPYYPVYPVYHPQYPENNYLNNYYDGNDHMYRSRMDPNYFSPQFSGYWPYGTSPPSDNRY